MRRHIQGHAAIPVPFCSHACHQCHHCPVSPWSRYPPPGQNGYHHLCKVSDNAGLEKVNVPLEEGDPTALGSQRGAGELPPPKAGSFPISSAILENIFQETEAL